MELDLLNLVTNYRISKDLSVLSRLDKISSVAMSHSVHMVKEEKASHENFPERNKYLVNEEKALAVGENIAYGFGTVEGAFNSWINSEGHHKLLLKDTYTHFGISIEKGHNGILSITLMFIKK